MAKETIQNIREAELKAKELVKDAEAQKAENAENAETSTAPTQSHPDESQDRHS